LTVIVNEQPVPAVGVQVTVVVPTGKKLPDAGTQVTTPQAPLSIVLNATEAPHCPGSFDVMIFAGHISSQIEAS
jgi:hypothetical protein